MSLLLLLLGCSSEPDWLRPTPITAEPCVPEDGEALSGEVAVQIFADDTAPALIARHTQAAAGYYARLGLTLRAAGPVRPAPSGPMLAEGATPEALLAPLLAFARQHALPAQPGTVLVVVTRLAPPDSSITRFFDDLSALSFSPALSELAGGEGIDLKALLGSDFTPIVLLSGEALAVSRPSHLDMLLPHELGHALGLAHVTDPDNLLRQGRWFSCLPVLTAGQRRAIQAEQKR